MRVGAGPARKVNLPAIARPRKALPSVSLAIVAGLTLIGCFQSSTPTTAATPWPTLAPLGTPLAVADAVSRGQGPQLVDHFKIDITPEALAVFPLEGRIEHPVRIEVIILSGQPDPFIVIQNQAGDQIAQSNRGGVGVPEVIGQFQFPKDGYYQLGIGSKTGSGEVGVSVYQLDSTQVEGGGTFTSVPQEVKGTLRQPASYQSYRLPLVRGRRVDITAKALTESLYLQFDVYSPDGSLLASRDNADGTDPALWNLMADVTGNYTIVVSNGDEHVGDYSLNVAPSSPGGQAVVGQRTMLDLGQKSTWLTFDSPAYDGIYVEAKAEGSGVSPTIAVYDQFGNRLTQPDQSNPSDLESLALVQLPFDGTYQIEFSARGNPGQIEYYIRRVRLVDAGMGGQIYPGGRSEKGEITGAGTVLTYFFDGKQGDLIGVDAHGTGGTGLDLGFDLYGPDGTRLLTRDDVVGKDPVLDRYQLPSAGRYVLALWNFGDTNGPFEIYVSTPQAPATLPPG